MTTKQHKRLGFLVPFISLNLYAGFWLIEYKIAGSPPTQIVKPLLPFEQPPFLPSSVLNHANLENGISAISHVSFLLAMVL